MDRDILSFLPPGYTARQCQIDYWNWLVENFDKYDVILVRGPTGSGKSLMNVVAALYLVWRHLTVALTTPRKFLQDQYTDDFSWITVLKGASAYMCADCLFRGASCRAVKQATDHMCEDCVYKQARAAAAAAQFALFNAHSYFVNKMFKDVLIADEGHGLVDLLYGLFGRKLWKCEFQYPDDIEVTTAGIAAFIDNTVVGNLADRLAIVINNHAADTIINQIQEEIDSFKLLSGALKRYGPDFLVKKKVGKYQGPERHLKGTEQEFLYVKTKKIDQLAEKILWPDDKVTKIILTSATIGPEDIELLGLQKRRVGIYECASPIPPENRFFVSEPTAPMTYKHRAESLPKIAKKIIEIAARHPNDKGVVHCTYEVAKSLQAYLGKNPRFWFHTQRDKDERLEQFLVAAGNPILVASGMAEGIDLKDDRARFQIICMLQWPSLDDDVMQWLSVTYPKRYRWFAIRNMIQQVGRISRHKDDSGITYFIGSEFNNGFFNENRGMFPEWFVEAMVWS
jgi:Rad3-related DNA helicase